MDFETAEKSSNKKKFLKQKNFWLGVGAALILFLIFYLGGKFLSQSSTLNDFRGAFRATVSDVFGSKEGKPIYEVELATEREENLAEEGEGDLVLAEKGKIAGEKPAEGVESLASDQSLASTKTEKSGEEEKNQTLAILKNPLPISKSPEAMKVLISEVMVGSSASTDDEFIEIYNYGSELADLTGWSIRKKSASGSEQMLVSSERLKGKIILPERYFLLVHGGGYAGTVSADVTWPSSYALAYKNNSIIVYNSSGVLVDQVTWAEIPKNKSYARLSLNIAAGFGLLDVPTPVNSSR